MSHHSATVARAALLLRNLQPLATPDALNPTLPMRQPALTNSTVIRR